MIKATRTVKEEFVSRHNVCVEGGREGGRELLQSEVSQRPPGAPAPLNCDESIHNDLGSTIRTSGILLYSPKVLWLGPFNPLHSTLMPTNTILKSVTVLLQAPQGQRAARRSVRTTQAEQLGLLSPDATTIGTQKISDKYSNLIVKYVLLAWIQVIGAHNGASSESRSWFWDNLFRWRNSKKYSTVCCQWQPPGLKCTRQEPSPIDRVSQHTPEFRGMFSTDYKLDHNVLIPSKVYCQNSNCTTYVTRTSVLVSNTRNTPVNVPGSKWRLLSNVLAHVCKTNENGH